MSKSNAAEEKLLRLIFNGTAWSGIAEPQVGGLTSLYLALHTVDPGEGGNQATNEVAYGGYSRIAVARTTAGWTVTGSSVSPAVALEWPAMTGGAAGVATHMSIGTQQSGQGEIIYKGALSPTIPYNEGTVPRLRTNSTIQED